MKRNHVEGLIDDAKRHGLIEPNEFNGIPGTADDVLAAAREQGKFGFILENPGERFLNLLEYVNDVEYEFKPWTFLVRDQWVVIIVDDERDAVYLRMCYKD